MSAGCRGTGLKTMDGGYQCQKNGENVGIKTILVPAANVNLATLLREVLIKRNNHGGWIIHKQDGDLLSLKIFDFQGEKNLSNGLKHKKGIYL